MQPGRNEAGNMRDIDQEIGTDRFRNLLETWKIEYAGIRAGPHHNHAWAAFLSNLLYCIIVDGFGLAINAIGEDPKENAGEIDLAPMRQMAALSQIHPENRIARF